MMTLNQLSGTILFSYNVAMLNAAASLHFLYLSLYFLDPDSMKKVFLCLVLGVNSIAFGLDSLDGWVAWFTFFLASWITQSEPGESRTIIFLLLSLM